MKTIAAIPVKNKIQWTAPLIEHLLLGDSVDEIWVYDNGSYDITPKWVYHRMQIDSRLKLIDATGMRLYDMWNHMIKTASVLENQVNLAILNNDIRLPINAISDMSRVMRDGNYTIATIDPSRNAIYTPSIKNYSGGSLLSRPIEPYAEKIKPEKRIGFAFVVAAEFWRDEEYAIHPDFILWWGDDDLFLRNAKMGGASCWVRGVGCDHAESITTNENPDRHESIERDRATFKKMKESGCYNV
jgi:GT2 family glycosyltransferase